jgi:MOSC domain-containing protein YiiM
MQSSIVSLNIGGPSEMHWQSKVVVSSMKKTPVQGPIEVRVDQVVGNTFANPRVHGSNDAILYAFGMTSALEYVKRLGLDRYEPGSTGETLTLDSFDEAQISVGDVFKIGAVVAQAVLPRIPCFKLHARMQHPEAQKLMEDCGRSGVYFRILTPGLIYQTDTVRRIQRPSVEFLISDLYLKMLKQLPMTPDDIERAVENGAFPGQMIEKWKAMK